MSMYLYTLFANCSAHNVFIAVLRHIRRSTKERGNESTAMLHRMQFALWWVIAVCWLHRLTRKYYDLLDRAALTALLRCHHLQLFLREDRADNAIMATRAMNDAMCRFGLATLFNAHRYREICGRALLSSGLRCLHGGRLIGLRSCALLGIVDRFHGDHCIAMLAIAGRLAVAMPETEIVAGNAIPGLHFAFLIERFGGFGEVAEECAGHFVCDAGED